MRTVEMEAVSVTAEEDDAETLSSGPGLPPMSWQRTILLVACGGVAGGTLRELITLLMPTIQTPTLIEVPRSTLLVNVVGCVGLGILTGLLERQPDAPRWMRPLLGIGFLEGFTIYSGVVLEGSAMIGADFPALAFMYGVLTLFGAVCGILLGLGLAGILHRRGIRVGGRTPRARNGADAPRPGTDASQHPAPAPPLDDPGDAEAHTTLSSARPAPSSAPSASTPNPPTARPANPPSSRPVDPPTPRHADPDPTEEQS